MRSFNESANSLCLAAFLDKGITTYVIASDTSLMLMNACLVSSIWSKALFFIKHFFSCSYSLSIYFYTSPSSFSSPSDECREITLYYLLSYNRDDFLDLVALCWGDSSIFNYYECTSILNSSFNYLCICYLYFIKI